MTTAADRGYLSIGEVLSLLQDDFPDVTISKIRFLESQGLIDPERTPSGYRKFYEDDVKRLRFILHEQRANFLPLRVIKDRLGNPIEEAEVDAPLATLPPLSTSGAGATAPSPPPATAAVAGSMVAATAPLAGAPAAGAPAPAASPTIAASLVDDLTALATGVSMTADELVRTSGLTSTNLRELEGFGLIVSRPMGRTAVYDEDALAVARLAAGFIRHGIEPRHLRMYKTAVEREASLFEQAVLPMLKQRNPAARAQALETLRTLVGHGEGLRVLLARRVLQTYQGPSAADPGVR